MSNKATGLVEFAVDTFSSFNSSIPASVKNRVSELIIDQIGLQIACAELPWSRAVYNYSLRFSASKGRSTVAYFGETLSAEGAAFVNACFGHGQDFDDTHLEVQTHPGSTIIPVAIAVGEEVGASGKDIFKAIIAGLEVMLRVAYSVSPGCLKRGHHTPPAAGPFGAAITTGLIIGLSPKKLVNAMGIAGSFSGGLLEYTQSGGSVKRIHNAIPTTAGIRAAYFASEGMTGPATILEGKRGFCKVFSDCSEPERITAKLGKEYLIDGLALKAYNCCYFIHAPLEAFLMLCDNHNLQAEDIEKVKVGVSEYSLTHVGQIPEPQDLLGAQFSLHFTLSLSLFNGAPGISDYTSEQLHNSSIRLFAKKIEVYEDSIATKEYPSNWGGVVTIITKSGQKLTQRIRNPKGTPENKMSKEEIKAKFYNNVVSSLGDIKTISLYNQLENFESIARIESLTALFKNSYVSPSETTEMLTA